MKNYINTQDEYEGTTINRVFSTDYMELAVLFMSKIEEIKETGKHATYHVGIGGSIYGDPVIHKNILYVSCCDKNLYAVSLKGKEIWRFPTNHVIGDLEIYEDKLFFGSLMGISIA
ncbi:MAG: hypothetical protein KKC05_01980 [Nanoarchaeota archaeon]|nr:hypothetical protein [Nanoarchaeota archaeon]